MKVVTEKEYILKLRILVPFYNAAGTLERLIESLVAQTDQDFDTLFLDDCSTDNSREVIEQEFAKYRNNPAVLNYVKNEENIGIMRNVVQGVEQTDDDVIYCILDGDDFLYPHAVETVKKAYEENDYDFAWSNFTFYPHLRPGFCGEINRGVSARIFFPIWKMSHMRTWKAGTFKKIDYDKKFKWQGEWFNFANDLAIQFALQEVTDKYGHIPEQLYYHDISEGENTTRNPEKRKKQLIEETRIRSLFDDEDAFVANHYFRHVIMLNERLIDAVERDSEFKAVLKSRGFEFD